MRFLKRQSIDRRALVDNRLAVNIDGSVIMGTTNNLLIPGGSNNNRPSSPTLGMIRFNTDSNEVEVYQGTAWRAIRYKEHAGITQQSLDFGDDCKTDFGPLNPAPPVSSLVQSGETWSGANLIVLVENVVQLFNTNYIIVTKTATNTDISFTASTKTISSVTTNFVTSNFKECDTIIVSGSGSNDGTYTIAQPVTSNEIIVNEPLNDESAGANITISAPGYYISFGSPVPDGKPVTVLHGFDQ